MRKQKYSVGDCIEYFLRISVQLVNRLLFSYPQVSISVGDYFENQVASMETLVAMAPKVVAARKVVGIPYLATLNQINVSAKYSEENSVSGKISKIRECRIEIGKVPCGLGFYCYTHSITRASVANAKRPVSYKFLKLE